MNDTKQNVIFLSKIERWTANNLDAEHGFKNEVIPALGCTPEEAIKNNFEALIDYIEAIKIGGFT